jgi:hypothetical protein
LEAVITELVSECSDTARKFIVGIPVAPRLLPPVIEHDKTGQIGVGDSRLK